MYGDHIGQLNFREITFYYWAGSALIESFFLAVYEPSFSIKITGSTQYAKYCIDHTLRSSGFQNQCHRYRYNLQMNLRFYSQLSYLSLSHLLPSSLSSFNANFAYPNADSALYSLISTLYLPIAPL